MVPNKGEIMEEILKIEGLSKKYGTNLVLNNINLSVNKGDIYGILGLSGAGKSTLVRCINNPEDFDEGHIYFHGKDADFSREYRRKVTMIFQSFNLLSQRTVLKNVMISGELVHDKNAKEKAIHLLELVGLKDKINAYPANLSGGQCQRVAIARALMTNPEILLCDEATSALDPETTHSILELLKKLNTELGLTIIIISHQMSVIDAICNKVAIIDKSQIVENGPTMDIFLSPKTEIGKKLICSGHINTKLSDEKMIKLIFNGEVDSPIVANIICDCNIMLSIMYAQTKTQDGKIYGQIIFKLPYYEHDILKLKKYLEFKGIKYEEVLVNELV